MSYLGMVAAMPAAQHLHVHVSCGCDEEDEVGWLTAINDLRSYLMTQFDDLNAAITQLSTDLTEAITRVEAKVTELGEPDQDLTDAIQRIKDVSTGLDNVVPDVPTDTGPVDTGTPGPTPDTGDSGTNPVEQP